MNRAFFVISGLAGVMALVVSVLAVQSFRAPAVTIEGKARTAQIVALVLLGLGVVVFGTAALATGGDISGPAMLPPAALLAATGVLALRRPDTAGRLLLWSAAVLVPLTFVIAVAVSASNSGRPMMATVSNAIGGAVFSTFFAIPAAITGGLLRRAARDTASGEVPVP